MIEYFNDFEREVFETLNKHGESYVVGGFVRDILLGKVTPKNKKNIMELTVDSVNDVDIVTVLTVDEVTELFEDKYFVDPYGAFFGTVGVCNDDECIDVTTMKENIILDGDELKVVFGRDIYKDLLLRDFTINTLLIDKDYKLVDILNAREDVVNRILRFPPSKFPRYHIDPIVLFRAARFISRGFNPTKEVIDAFYDPRGRERLQYLSDWRVLKEMKKMSKGKLVNGLYYLHDSGLLYEFFPVLEKHKDYIDEAIKTGKKKEFINYLIEHDPDYNEVFIILQIPLKHNRTVPLL